MAERRNRGSEYQPPPPRDMPTAIPIDPRRTVRRRVLVIVVRAVLNQLNHVAGHVVEAKRIGLERPDR